MATDIAANSDSTLMNSQRAERARLHHLAQPLDDVGLRRDRVGADHLRPAQGDGFGDGVRAFSLLEHVRPRVISTAHVRVGRAGRGDVALGHLAGELFADRRGHRLERDPPRHRGESAQQRRVGHRPADVLEREVGRRHACTGVPAASLREFADAEFVEGARGVDEDVALARQAAEHIHLVQQRRVLDDQRVGLQDRLAQADLLVVDAAERDHRRAGALRAEAREGLRVAAFAERRDRQHFRRGHHALAAAAVNADLEHRPSARPRQDGCGRGW